MGKRTPHCKLQLVQRLVGSGQVRATASALAGARGMGIVNLAGMCDVDMALQTSNFYKSMTTHADHQIWQDVYRTATQGGDEIYLKLTVIEGVLIVSFKEL